MPEHLEVNKLVDDYLEGREWRVKENANIKQSFSGLMFHLSNTVIANYTLNKVYTPEIARAHIEGDFHIHDLGMGCVGYCMGWSLMDLLRKGFGGVPGHIKSAPARHLDTALLQMANFIGSLQNEWAGAQAFNDLDVLLAPFIWKDNLTYLKVKQLLQQFVFNLNITSRWGGQTPFTNVTLDLTVPKDLENMPAIIGGEPIDRAYGEFEEEIETFDKAFLEVLYEGDGAGTPFTFPIPTFNITKDFDWDSMVSLLLFKLTGRFGSPYFANFVHSNLNPSDIRSMCCHLRLDITELKRNITGGLFGSSDKTGSIGVVTINMPRIGFLSKNEDEFFERLSRVMDLAKESLEIKRRKVEENIERGLLPYTKVYLGNLNNHFSTIGLIGMNECCLNFLNCSIETKEGLAFSKRVLLFMLEKIKEYQGETSNLYNLEATPAEGTSYRLAKIDKQRYRGIITAGEEAPFYTNSTCLPVNTSLSFVEALRHQEELQQLYTGGTVHHIFMGEYLSPNGCKEVIRRIVHNFKLPYITITPVFSICPNDGYLNGEHHVCPKCNSKTEVYSRIVGYYRPIGNWNFGKREEFRLRKHYDNNLSPINRNN